IRAPGATIPAALTAQLGPELLDDDDADLDDLASIGALVAEDPSFAGALVGQTFSGTGYTLEITSVDLSSADLDITPQTGTIAVQTRLYGVDDTFDADVEGLFTVSGSSHADVMVLDLVLGLDTHAGRVDVVTRSSSASFQGFSFEVEW